MPANTWQHVTPALLDVIRARYRLDWHGIHGIDHWERVRDNGFRLAAVTGADVVVVEYFAALHDSCRWDNGRDPEHGARAAAFVRTLDRSLLSVTDDQLEVLVEACRLHTWGTETDDATMGTCWDADRLDLMRVGRRPDPAQLVTEAARDPAVIEWAISRVNRGG